MCSPWLIARLSLARAGLCELAMTRSDDRDERALQRRLERLNAAIDGRLIAGREQRRTEPSVRRSNSIRRAMGALPIAIAFIAVAIATGRSGLLIPGIII